MKRAYEAGRDAARAGGCGAGPVMHRVFQRAIAAAKSARSETGLSRRGGSVGSVAVTLARTVFQGFEDKEILCVGAGGDRQGDDAAVRAAPAGAGVPDEPEPGAGGGALRHAGTLGASGPGPGRCVNSTTRCGPRTSRSFATAATEPVLTAAALAAIQKKRRGRPLLVLDLGLPRDVEPAAAGLPRVYLYNVDDLQEVVDHDPERRSAIEACSLRVAAAAEACVADLEAPGSRPGDRAAQGAAPRGRRDRGGADTRAPAGPAARRQARRRDPARRSTRC